ncbi:RNase adapter RapZ [Desulfolucanica intricata]|uniref:RNase adapter RapZ n=1 Tax=Desulfolucanica intricata TaxID=1285191 RepID=UPI00082F59FD|nr:RNase adapter RapZ [Desulfolucanica intricata]
MFQLVFVTGLSGAGKTQALRSLEDLGFFCVDNLPPALIPKFTELCAQSAGQINRIALVVDIRGGEFFDTLFGVLTELRNSEIRYEILFLEASNETLVRRFKESRRRHPLNDDMLEGIMEERTRLLELRGRADRIIDTTNLTNQQLKEELYGIYGSDSDASKMVITVMSFGYKYGLPLDSDLVIDVRFLPNPHYEPSLKNFTGNDPVVQEYVFKSPVTSDFMERLTELVEFLIPYYIKEGKSSLTIAIGCTGGKHRSVTLANRMSDVLKKKDHRVIVKHRDIKRA